MKRAKILSLALVVVLLALVIALFTIPVAAEETLPEAGQVMTEDVVTEYGTIPKEYANQTDYPFVIFKNGEFISAAKHWSYKTTDPGKGQADSGALTEVKSNVTKDVAMTILMRRDYSHETASSFVWLGHINCTVNVDFGGHKFICTQGWRTPVNISSYSTSIYPIYNFYDGEILLKGSSTPFLSFSGGSKAQEFKVSFTNVKFGYASSAVEYAFIKAGSANVYKVELTLDNCEFDLATNAPAGTTPTILDLAGNDTDSTGKLDIKINGGKIKVNDPTKFAVASGLTDGVDFVTYGEYEGQKFTLEMPKGKAAPTSFWGVGTDTYSFYYTTRVNNTTDVYTIYKDAFFETGDSTLRYPEIYSDENTYPFIWFKDGIFKGADTKWLNTTSNVTTGAFWSARSSGLHGGSYVDMYLRRDYEIQTGNCSNTGQATGTLNLNLMGNTLRTGTANFFSYSTKAANGVFEFNAKNGDIKLYRGTLVWGYTNNKDNATASFNFENIDFSLATGSNSTKLIEVTATNDLALKSTMNFEFKDCTFDFETNRPTDSFTMFDMSNRQYDTITANAKLIGCDVNIGTGSFTLYKTAEGTKDTFTAERSNQKYLTVEVAKGADAPTGEYVGENGAALVFKKTGETETTTIYELQLKEIADVNFIPKTSVTLGSDLTLNIYIPFIPEFSSMWFDLPGADEKILAADITEDFLVTLEDGKKYIHVESPMSAFEAAAVLPLCVELEIGGSLYTGKWSISIPKYVEKVLAKSDIGTTEKTLAKDILAYIRSAFAFEGLEDSDEVKAIDEILDGYTSDNTINVQNAIKDSDLVGATFVLDSTPAVRFYIGDYNYDQFTFFVGGKAVDEEYMTYGSDDDYGAYVDISLYAYQMTETFSYVIDVEEGEDITGAYNLISYYAYISGEGENDYDGADKALLTDLVAKFYNYCASAAAYRNN